MVHRTLKAARWAELVESIKASLPPGLVEYAEPRTFCERHKGQTVMKRCAHLGNRFVVWLCTDIDPDDIWVDYVEDVDNDVVVESHAALGTDEANELWAVMVAKMVAGRPPEKDRSAW